ncbi:9267_t:CDS:2 [Cetraspora pellucida]|uniref:9267_t:CDS:1 n=1 Tax=Cetraspora pellucida TaxID=1433469 RepID=A0ACA9M976_9GLOM|nr:9267_t:CDS:2 [Cetraspora pellucida]
MAPNSFITPGGLQQRPEVNVNEPPQTGTLSSNYFTQSWSEWTSLVSQQKPQIPKPPTDSLKLQQYIINSNGWWPVFGGEPKLKRKCDSSTSAFVVSPMSRQTPVSLVPSEFSKRRKIHNCPHFSSQFSCKNYLAVEWDPEENEFRTAEPPRTTTSALPQENFAAVTSRILLVRRLKAKQGNMLKGDAASRFRKNILVKVAQGGVAYGDINTVIESPANDADVIIKRPWRDGTTEPGEGTFEELKSLRHRRASELNLRRTCQIFPNATSAHELLEQAREYFRVHKGKNRIIFIPPHIRGLFPTLVGGISSPPLPSANRRGASLVIGKFEGSCGSSLSFTAPPNETVCFSSAAPSSSRNQRPPDYHYGGIIAPSISSNVRPTAQNSSDSSFVRNRDYFGHVSSPPVAKIM